MPEDKYSPEYGTLDLPGKGDEAAMLDYIQGKEKTGPFPLGHIPTDHAAVREAMQGRGLGQDKESNGGRDPDRG